MTSSYAIYLSSPPLGLPCESVTLPSTLSHNFQWSPTRKHAIVWKLTISSPPGLHQVCTNDNYRAQLSSPFPTFLHSLISLLSFFHLGDCLVVVHTSIHAPSYVLLSSQQCTSPNTGSQPFISDSLRALVTYYLSFVDQLGVRLLGITPNDGCMRMDE